MSAIVSAAQRRLQSVSLLRVVAGLLFFQHGAQKLWGFAGGKMTSIDFTLRGVAGPLEVCGGLLLVLGLFTRTTAFILCGEMAVAYFTQWAPRGFFPINNGGEEAVIDCFLFLWLVTAGPGPWGLDALLKPLRDTRIREAISSWEGYARSLMRIILAVVFSLHGYRHLFGAFPRLGGRTGAVGMALDGLPAIWGVLEIAGGLLLILGVFTRWTALVLCCELLAAYFFVAAPRAIWPIRNWGNEVLLYFLAFLYLAVSGAGTWSLDHFQKQRAGKVARPIAAEET